LKHKEKTRGYLAERVTIVLFRQLKLRSYGIEKRNYNTIVLFNEEESVHLTNLRECRISAVRKKNKNETQDNEIKDLKLNRRRRRRKRLFLLAMTDAICAPERKKQTKKRKNKNSENCTTSTMFFVVIFFSFDI
jgi:hypothetical protein